MRPLGKPPPKAMSKLKDPDEYRSLQSIHLKRCVLTANTPLRSPRIGKEFCPPYSEVCGIEDLTQQLQENVTYAPKFAMMHIEKSLAKQLKNFRIIAIGPAIGDLSRSHQRTAIQKSRRSAARLTLAMASH